MSPSTWAFTVSSDPSGTTKPLFLQGVGPGPDRGVVALGLAWSLVARPGTLDWRLKWKGTGRKKKSFTLGFQRQFLITGDRSQADGPGSWGAADEQQ